MCTVLYLETLFLVEALPNFRNPKDPKENGSFFVKETTFVNVAKPTNGWFGHKMAQSMGFWANLSKNPYLESFL